MEDNVTISYLRELEMQKLESILVFCIQPQNFYSYGHLAEIAVNILEKKIMDAPKDWEEKLKLYREKIKLAKEMADRNPPQKECIV